MFALAETGLAILAIFISPSEVGNAWLLGLSVSRWAMVVLLGLFAFGIGLFYRAFVTHADLRKRAESSIKSSWYWAIVGLSLLGLVTCLYLGLLSFKFTDTLILARLLRLRPIIFLVFLLSLQTLWLATAHRKGTERPDFASLLTPTTIAAVMLSLITLIISSTRVGLQPDRAGWDSPGVPLMATQVALAWLLAVAFVPLLHWIENNSRIKSADRLICAALWLVAVLIWNWQPLAPTFFSPAVQPPNFEYYPYTDAATHDLVAQNILIGEGFGATSEKPLYSLFLAIGHALVGQDYTSIIFFQIAVLAIFPAVLYLLGARLHGRLTGALLALAVILREGNAIALSGQLNVSHVKLLMTELPTALGLAMLCLLSISWLSAKSRSPRAALLVGGALGCLLLLRTQTLVFLPPLLLLAFFTAGSDSRIRLHAAGMLVLGVVLVTLPWMLRNQFVTGQFGFSQSLQGIYLAKQYSLTPELGDPGFPENTPVSEYSALGFAHVIQFTRAYPGEVARFVLAHFAHNEVSAFLSLPMRFDLADKLITFYNLRPYWIGLEGRLWSECCSLAAHIAAAPYWDSWNGVFPPEARLPIAINLAFIAIGLGSAWRRYGWLGLLPLGVHLLYNLSTALARVSGWRLNLPVDWALILYYCAGLAQLTLWGWQLISKTAVDDSKPEARKTRKVAQADWRRLAVALLAIGLLFPLADLAVPARYLELDDSAAQEAWQRSPISASTSLDIAAFLDQPGAVALNGRALWPRYYAADAGEPGGGWPAYNALPFARLGFVLVGPLGGQVALPLSAAPAAFPNASDVIVYGCRAEGVVRAVAVLFPQNEQLDLLSDFHTFSCGAP